MFKDYSCDAFSERLASTAAVPGGGGAAALCGAMSASLCAMAAGLTVNKKKYAEHADSLNGIITKCEALRKEFLRLIDADAEGFAPMASAYSLPRDTEGYAEAIRSATLTALQAPYAMTALCCEAIELIEVLCDGKCSMLMISDAGCAAALCRSALSCAAMNVFVNTKALRGDVEAEEAASKVKAALCEYLPRAEKLSSDILARLSEV